MNFHVLGGLRGAFGAFLRAEILGSVSLIIATIAALLWANSPWSATYFSLLNTHVGLSWGTHSFSMPLKHWVNDGLMALFFFVVGLEIKREIVVGHLAAPGKAALPIAGALGGMVLPAIIYMVIAGGGEAAAGWGIPMATDIAFAVGVLSLFGDRVPLSLKVFLSALAIVDDIGAVFVIALFYTTSISWIALLAAAVLLGILWWASARGIKNVLVYATLIPCVWIAVLASGVHATVAGILIAFTVPVRARIDPEKFASVLRARFNDLERSVLTRESMLHDHQQLDTIVELDLVTRALRPKGITLEHFLHPFQAYIVLPAFALCNAGVHFDSPLHSTLTSPVSVAVIAGLFLGKQLGIQLFCFGAVRTGWAELPKGVNFLQIYAVSCVAGIGFTMSLFITELAFRSETLLSQAKSAVFMASLLSALWGILAVYSATMRANRHKKAAS